MSGIIRRRHKRCWQGYSGAACCHLAPLWIEVNTVQVLRNGAVLGIKDRRFVNRTLALPSGGGGTNEPQEKPVSKAAARTSISCQNTCALASTLAYFVLPYEGCSSGLSVSEGVSVGTCVLPMLVWRRVSFTLSPLADSLSFLDWRVNEGENGLDHDVHRCS